MVAALRGLGLAWCFPSPTPASDFSSAPVVLRRQLTFPSLRCMVLRKILIPMSLFCRCFFFSQCFIQVGELKLMSWLRETTAGKPLLVFLLARSSRMNNCHVHRSKRCTVLYGSTIHITTASPRLSKRFFSGQICVPTYAFVSLSLSLRFHSVVWQTF